VFLLDLFWVGEVVIDLSIDLLTVMVVVVLFV